MSVTVCTNYVFGTDLGIQNKTVSKDVRWHTIGNWEGGVYVIKCKVCMSVQVNHTVSYFGGALSVEEPTPYLDIASELYLASHQVQYSRDNMLVETFNWIEIVAGQLCEALGPDWTPTLPGGNCCFGLKGCIQSATFRETVNFKDIPGPTGLDGSDENNPLQGPVLIKGLSKKTSLTFTSDVELDDPETTIAESAVGVCSSGISGDDINITQESKNANYNTFQTWTYTIEKEESLSV